MSLNNTINEPADHSTSHGFEEVIPEGVNRPNSLELINRHGGATTTNAVFTSNNKGFSLYEQLRSSSGLNPFRAESPLDERLQNPQTNLDRKITEILGKYLNSSPPQKI